MLAGFSIGVRYTYFSLPAISDMTVNQEPYIAVAGIVRRQNVFLRVAKQVFAICGCFPNQEAFDWEAPGNAVEQVARSARIPDKFSLDFWHCENSLFAEVPEPTNCQSFDGDATHI